MCLIQSLVWMKGNVRRAMKPTGSVSPAKYSSPALRIPLYPITACKRSTLLPRQGSQRARLSRCRSGPYRVEKRRRMRALCCTGVRQVSCCIFQFCVSARTKLQRVHDKSRLSLPPVRRERPPPSQVHVTATLLEVATDRLLLAWAVRRRESRTCKTRRLADFYLSCL